MQLASFALWAVPVSINRSVFFCGFACLQVTFSYSVKWSPTTITYDQRLQRYERFPLNPIHLEIHWFSIVNSCVTVLLLTGFLATILMRVLKNDFVKFSKEDGEGGAAGPQRVEGHLLARFLVPLYGYTTCWCIFVHINSCAPTPSRLCQGWRTL